MIPRPSFLAFALALALVAGAVVANPFDASALAQTREPTRPFATQVAQWTRLLDGVEAYAEGVDHDPQRSADFRRVAKDVGAKAEAAKKRAEEQIASLSALLDTLGPAPAEDAPPEPRAVAEKRAQYAEDIAAYRGRVALAELTMTRAADLARAISSLARQSLIERLTNERPTPVAPERLAKAVPGFVAALYKLARSPVDWYWGLPTEVRAKVKFYPFFIVALLAAAFGWAIRRALLRWYMRDPAIERPTYARRLIAAGAEGVAIGIVPALILAAFVYQATRPTALISGLFAHVVEALGLALIFFALVAGLVRAALAPDTPAWRLTALTPEGARTTGRRIVVLAAIVAVDIFLSRSTRELDLGPEVEQLYGLVVNTLEGIGILFLMGARQWRGGELRDPDEDVRAETATARRPSRFWLLARGAVASIAMVGIASAFIGYGALSQYLIKNLLASGVIFGVLYTLRGLLRDLIGALMRSAFARRQLGMRHALRRTVKFWARAALDPLLLGASLYVVLPWWGVPLSDLADWTAGIMAGFTIGGVTIAPADIAFAILVFVGMVAGTRLLQRLLGERVLPETRLDDSLRHSITAAVGYIGMTLAVAVAIATLGFSLDNLALIAGALSVGIGFGLQNVVNNFVSGIILLIERPVKVGDWVVVGVHEGTVKNIRVRATEIETFQRASVIIPNSELLSTTVTNWTLADKYGRVEVRVGVAYGSDTERVREILLACARDHPRIAAWPEAYVVLQDFGASSLDFELRAYLYDVGWIVRVGSDLRFAIDKAFREAGIEIPFPQTDVHLRDIERLEKAIKGGRGGSSGRPRSSRSDPKSGKREDPS